MGLHETDKNTHRRIVPTLNVSDSLAQRMAHGTISNTYKSSSNPGSQRIQFKNGLILTYDQDNKVSSVYGYIPELTDEPVFIIAKSGYDVFSDILGITAPTV